MKKIIVIGCGVSGLSSAIELQNNGYKVHIVSNRLPQHTTSSKAAAVWFPYKMSPQAFALQMSRASYLRFEELCHVKGSYVSMLQVRLLEPQKIEVPWWAEALPDPKFYSRLHSHLLPDGYADGFVVRAPLTENPGYLNFLYTTFQQNGGSIEQYEVTNIENLLLRFKNHVVVNCTGLGARQLLNDEHVYPIKGQIVQVQKQQGLYSAIDDEGKNAIAYIFERENDVILGGTAVEHDYSVTTSDLISNDILQRCANIQPQLQQAHVLNTYAALRPYRTSIRLETDAQLPVVHNYGHGGSGFTVSWGCAQEVCKLVARMA